MARWLGRSAEERAGPEHVVVVEAVLPLLGPPERWAVYTVPGPRDLPGPDAPRGRRERWWRDHVSAAGEALLLLEPGVHAGSVRRAVQVLVAVAVARERGATDAVDIAARRVVTDALDAPVELGRAHGGDLAPTTAVAVVRQVALWLTPAR
ncbi:hypothetical protein [Klenkia sesuvii]